MESRLTALCEGAQGVFVKNMRFNTTLISFNFYLPLEYDTAAVNGLLPFVLTTCSRSYPDFSRLNYKLNKLYGAELSASVEKLGDCQLLKMAISVIDDSFTLDGEELCATAADLLTDMIFEPMTQNGAFLDEDLEREKRKAVEHIIGEMSDKRTYAKGRMIEEMYKGSAYGVSKCGTVEQVNAVTGEELYRAWENMLSHAFVRVNVISRSLPSGLFDKISKRFEGIKREDITDVRKTEPTLPTEKVKRVTERMDIAQGKLVMGFSCKNYAVGESSLATLIAGDIFGGGTYSRLFANVREKMSLCYYCSASTVRIKGLMTVDSGVELSNVKLAEKEILNQLLIVKRGEFEDADLEASVKSLYDTMCSYEDNQTTIDSWYCARVRTDTLTAPSEAAQKLKAVTREQVIEAANEMKLHTVYKLLPEKEAEKC